MANLTFDFLHNYVTGERRASDPADAYQYDEGRVLEAVVPVAVTSCEIQYWIRGMEKADAYTPTSITQNTDNTYTILGNVPNSYFETCGDLRVYIVVTDGDASITTYEGYIHIKERQMPEDYVDDDPDNEAVRVITEAQAAAATATEKAGEAAESAEQAQEILDSIPEDYSQLSEDVSNLKDDLTAVESDVTDLKDGLYQVIEPFKVTNSGAGGVNVAYPMSVGDSILVTNKTSASIEVRQRNSVPTVIATTVVLSGTTRKITSTVDSVDIRFYFNQGGTILFEDADKRLPIVEEKVSEIKELASINEFLTKQLIESKLIFSRADYNSDKLNTDVVVAEFDVDGKYDTVYIKADAMSNVTNNYPIGIKEYDSSDTQVSITGRPQAGIIKGTSISLSNSNTVKVRVYINVGTNAANSIKNVFVWRTKTGRINNKPYPVFYVEKDGSGDFTSLVDAITEATRYMDAKVYVGAGTWDIIEELGESYLANVSDSQRGIYLKNRVHLICDSRSKIVANYTGNLNGVKTRLSIFNSGEYGFTLENATLEGSNIRYLIHDERDQDTVAYANKYINCTMTFDNRNNTAWSAKQCIGGGLGQNGYIDIEGCTFKSYQGYDGTVSYHNTGASTGRSHIVMRDCYFYLYNTFRLSWYGTSTDITDAVITNCYLGADIVHRAENSGATVENTSVIAWNNTINPHS